MGFRSEHRHNIEADYQSGTELPHSKGSADLIYALAQLFARLFSRNGRDNDGLNPLRDHLLDNFDLPSSSLMPFTSLLVGEAKHGIVRSSIFAPSDARQRIPFWLVRA